MAEDAFLSLYNLSSETNFARHQPAPARLLVVEQIAQVFHQIIIGIEQIEHRCTHAVEFAIATATAPYTTELHSNRFLGLPELYT
jgi:hypothetical protein